MFNFLLSLFGINTLNGIKYTLKNHFNVGDVCFWPGRIDGCEDAVVEIQNWYHDIENGKEVILYDFIDIYRNIEYDGVNENELNILAWKNELVENISPYSLEFGYKNIFDENEDW